MAIRHIHHSYPPALNLTSLFITGDTSILLSCAFHLSRRVPGSRSVSHIHFLLDFPIIYFSTLSLHSHLHSLTVLSSACISLSLSNSQVAGGGGGVTVTVSIRFNEA